MRKALSAGLLLAGMMLLTMPAIAQHECDTIPANVLQTATDSHGVVHQIECWNAATGQTSFPRSGGSGGVTSVFTRTGAVVAAAGDYSAVGSLNLGDGTQQILFNNSNITMNSAENAFFVLSGLAEWSLPGGIVDEFTTSGETLAEPLTVPSCIGCSSLQSATVTLSSAQILNLTAAPVQIVAGNSGHYFSIVQVNWELIFNSIVYVDGAGEALFVRLGASNAAIGINPPGTGAGNWFSTGATPLLTATSSQTLDGFGSASFSGQSGPAPNTQINGVGIFVGTNAAGDVTLGNGTLKITVYYYDFVL